MEKSIPTYIVTVDKNSDLGVEFISLVDEPAIMIDFVAMSKDEEQRVFMALADQQKLAGAFLIPDQKIYRNDNGEEYYITFTSETIRKIAERFNENLSQQNINLMHEKNSKVEGAFVLENWIIEDTNLDKSNKYGFTLPVGTWFGLVKVNNDAFWQDQVKSGKVRGFSIEGVLGMVKANFKKANMYKFKSIGMIAATNGEANGETVAIVAESFEIGEAVVIVGSDLTPVADFTGEITVDGTTVSVSAGVIAGVGSPEAPAEPAAPEAPAEAAPAAEPAPTGMGQEELNAMVESAMAQATERIAQLEERLGAIEAALNEAKAQAEQMSAQVAMSLNVEKVVDEPAKDETHADRVAKFKSFYSELQKNKKA